MIEAPTHLSNYLPTLYTGMKAFLNAPKWSNELEARLQGT